MTEDEETIARTIAEASVLPLKDAAYLLWRECSTLDLLAWRAMPPEVRDLFRSRRAGENSIEVKFGHDQPEDGLTFDRLQLTHPSIDDAEVRQAIIAAVKFHDACFGYSKKSRASSAQGSSARSNWRPETIPDIRNGLTSARDTTSAIT
ncbi:MAG: hypothetical protein H0V72_28800 [Bradyrhizobium sp.]|nr:hypothetical protein [Bradyrhizobium sp.]